MSAYLRMLMVSFFILAFGCAVVSAQYDEDTMSTTPDTTSAVQEDETEIQEMDNSMDVQEGDSIDNEGTGAF
ncbi:MAG: hypothetical protein PHP46_05615 [Candidatus Omnitrophica bacterium]|nr:hypothetical protein [Candidatus Omnitrophota bacterium]